MSSTMTPEKTAYSDEELLATLGYKQEFKREFSVWSTIAFAFSIMGVCASVSSTLSFGLVGGGHAGMVFGWLIPGFFVVPVSLCLAELCSSMPTSGGLYYWASRLASPDWQPYASWVTGYSNVLGQIALVSSIDYTAAQMICTAVTVASDFETIPSLATQYLVFIGLLATHLVVCSSATRILAKLNLVYVVINLATTIGTIICFAAVPKEHVSTVVAFTQFENGSSWSDGVSFLLAFTAPMWTLTGYDSAAHVAEETANAAIVAPLAMVVAVGSTWLLGFFMIIATSFAVLDVGGLLGTPLSLPMAQVYYDVLGKQGMLTIWSFIIIVQWATAAAQTVDASRVVFAFARDDALPGSRWTKQINARTQTPVYAVIFVVFSSAVLGLMALNVQAGLALFDVAVIALYLSYAIPILLRITGSSRFTPGPFHLGRWSIPLGTAAVAWVTFILVILLFPGNPSPGAEGMNYAVVVLGAILGGSTLYWIVDARFWFKGPVSNVNDTQSPSVASDEKLMEEKDGGTVAVVQPVDLSI